MLPAFPFVSWGGHSDSPFTYIYFYTNFNTVLHQLEVKTWYNDSINDALNSMGDDGAHWGKPMGSLPTSNSIWYQVKHHMDQPNPIFPFKLDLLDPNNPVLLTGDNSLCLLDTSSVAETVFDFPFNQTLGFAETEQEAEGVNLANDNPALLVQQIFAPEFPQELPDGNALFDEAVDTIIAVAGDDFWAAAVPSQEAKPAPKFDQIIQPGIPLFATLNTMPLVPFNNQDFSWSTYSTTPSFLDDSPAAIFEWSKKFTQFSEQVDLTSSYTHAVDQLLIMTANYCSNLSTLVSEKLITKATVENLKKLSQFNDLVDQGKSIFYFAGSQQELMDRLLTSAGPRYMRIPSCYIMEIIDFHVKLLIAFGLIFQFNNGYFIFCPFKVSHSRTASLSGETFFKSFPEYVSEDNRLAFIHSLIRIHYINRHFTSMSHSFHAGILRDGISRLKEEIQVLRSQSNQVIELVNPYSWS